MEAAELARWTRFAAKGGIGKCTAICDCVAESPDDLMFLKDDEITVLYQLPELEGFYLGYCEGVVGRFSGTDVAFHAKLKKPVMTKRSSMSSSTHDKSSSGPAKSPSPSRRGSIGRQRSLSGPGSRPQSRSQTPSTGMTPPASSPQPYAQPHRPASSPAPLLPPSRAGSVSASPLPHLHQSPSTATSPLLNSSSLADSTSSSSGTATATPPSRSGSYPQSHASNTSTHSSAVHAYAHAHKQTASYSSFTSASVAASPEAMVTTFAGASSTAMVNHGSGSCYAHTASSSNAANSSSASNSASTSSYVLTSAFSRDTDPTTPSSTSSYPASPPPTSPAHSTSRYPTRPTQGVSGLDLRASPLPRTSPVPTTQAHGPGPSRPYAFGTSPVPAPSSPTSPGFPTHETNETSPSPGSSYPASPVIASPASSATSGGSGSVGGARAASSWASGSSSLDEERRMGAEMDGLGLDGVGVGLVGTPLSLVFGGDVDGGGGGQGQGGNGERSGWGGAEVVQEEESEDESATPSEARAAASIVDPGSTENSNSTNSTSIPTTNAPTNATKRPANIPPPLILRATSSSSSTATHASAASTMADRTTSPLRIAKRQPGSPPANATSLSFAAAAAGARVYGVGGGVQRAPSVASVATSGYFTAPSTAAPSAPSGSESTTITANLDRAGPPSAASTATSPPDSALPSALDTSFSTMSDLAEAHPGRFSVWDVSASLKELAHMSGISEASASVYSYEESRVERVEEEEEEESGTAEGHTNANAINVTVNASAPTSASLKPPVSLQDYDHERDRDQVGIGLSLLQDLVGGMDDWSDSDEDGSVYESGSGAKGGVNGRGVGGVGGGEDPKKEREEREYEEALKRVGEGERGSMVVSEEGTAEGLMYARSEEGHGRVGRIEGALVEEAEEMNGGVEGKETETETKELQESLKSSFGADTRQAQTERQGFRSPATSPIGAGFPRQVAQPHSPTNTSSPTSPSSPFFPGPVPQPYARRPSLAPSAKSGISTSSWEGAGDIYDDYRYSRYSVMSKASLGFGGEGVGMGGEEKPPMPERSSVDSYDRRDRADSKERERRLQMSAILPPMAQRALALAQVDETDSPIDPFRSNALALKARGANVGNALVYPNARFVEVEETEEPEGGGEGEPGPGAGTGTGTGKGLRPDAKEKRERRSVLRASVDSEASVYTQNSRLSMLEREVEGVLAQAMGGRASRGSDRSEEQDDRASNASNGSGTRPPALSLNLSTSNLAPPPGVSPLLHTDWASPATATAVPLSPSPSAMNTPMPGGAGMASVLRMRLEGGRSPTPSDDETTKKTNANNDVSFDSSGLGSRIVVEDDEELPSRLIDEGKEEGSFVTEGDSVSTVKHHEEEEEDAKEKEKDVLAGLVQPHPARPSTQPQPPSHLRPNASALLAARAANEPGRRSLFAPHPNAPKAPAGAYIPLEGPLLGGVGVGAGMSPTGRGFGGPEGLGQEQQVQQAPQWQGQGYPQGPQGPIYPPLGPGYRPAPMQMRPSVINVIRMALSRPPPPNNPNPAARPPGAWLPPPSGPTIYARTEGDLSASLGPVPIVFSADALPPLASVQTGPPPSAAQVREGAVGRVNVVPRSGLAGLPIMAEPVRSASVPVPVPAMGVATGAATGAGRHQPARTNSVPVPPLAPRPNSIQAPARPSTSDGAQPGGGGGTQGAPIPRAGFAPHAPGLRPRSRSFSGFGGGGGTKGEESREDNDSTRDSVKRSLTTSSSTPPTITPIANSKTPAKSSPLRPSPLSLSSSTPLKPIITSPLIPKPPSSPLATQTPIVPPSPSPMPSFSDSTTFSLPTAPRDTPSPAFSSSNLSLRGSQQLQIRQMGSRATLGDPPSSATSSASGSSNPAFGRSTRVSLSRSTIDTASISSSSAGGRGSTNSLQPPNRPRAESSNAHLSISSLSNTGGAATRVVSPPPGSSSGGVVRQTSLRSKLSLPNLRRNKSKQDDELRSATSFDVEREHEHSASADKDKDTKVLQVQDTEFELVRPSFQQFHPARASEDSNVLGRETSFDGRLDTATPGGTFLRPESPAVSISSGGAGASSSRLSEQRSPTADSVSGPWIPQAQVPSAGASRANSDAESNMDAHRQREQKWMSLMSSAPAASSRKSKKVRKLLLEGVPSSVRYLVWSYLTDGKARCVPGVYAQLCGRGRVGASSAIQEDVGRAVCFEQVEREQGMVEDGGGARGYLSGTRGAVVTLLQAYLNMVPDVQYSMGLTLIVGQLLLLAPEEDAFWIFVSIMDTHVRAYFSSTTTQMEVDASLFTRALEANDAPLAKKLLVGLGVLPGALCGPWFSTLFVGTLPPEYLNRVWDLFLYEGIPFLLRVGLALMVCCRRKLLDATSEEVVLQTLAQPPTAWLPATPDAFLSLAFSVKLKDDDVRKQRVKMEAQVKRQTQAPRPSNVGGAGISLPRT